MTAKELFSQLTIKQVIMELEKEVYCRVHPASRRSGQYSNHSIRENGFSDGQEIIKKFLLDDKSCMMARFGATELKAFSNWLQVNNKLVDTFSYDKRKYKRNSKIS